MPVPMLPADGATLLDPAGAGDVQPSVAPAGPVAVAAIRADAGVGFTLGARGLAANADNEGAARVTRAHAIAHVPTGSGGAGGDGAGSTVHLGGSIVAGGVILGAADGTAPGSDAAAILDFGSAVPGGAASVSVDMVIAAGLADGAIDGMVSGGGAASAAPSGALSEAGGATTGPNDPHAGFASTTPVVVSGSTPGGLTFHISFDSSVASAPSSFDTEVIAAFQFYANTFNNPGVVLYYNVGYGEVQGGGGLGSALGESETFFGATKSYSTLRSTMSARAATGDGADQTAFANDMPATDPTGGMTLDMATAEEKALGFAPKSAGSFSNPDGNIGFNTSLFPGGAPEAGFLGVVEHEIAEVMGRSSWLDIPGEYGVMDLFRYAGPGSRQLSPSGNPSYFSLDNGKTDLYNWNNPSNALGDNGDLGDWLATNTYTPDAYNDDSDPTVNNPITSRDTTLMDVIGWDRASSTNYTVAAGHTSTGIVIYSGDNEFVKSGGTAVATFAMSGGLEVVSAGGEDRTAKLGAGAEQDVFGTARSVVVLGGTQIAASGGVVSGGTVSNGGGQYSDPGGAAIGTTIRSGGFQAVYGGTATGTVVSNGGAQFVGFGGKAVGAIVRSGGLEDVFSAGTTSRTTISKGGLETVSSGSVARATTISSGGGETVSAGGVASGGTIARGGTERVYGRAKWGVVNSGGKQIVESGGVASGVTVKLGGTQTVYAGGTTRATVLSGGTETVHGKVSGGTITGGLLDVASGGTASGTVTFVSGGTLQLDGLTGFTGVIGGFAVPDRIDLRGVAFGATTTRIFVEAPSATSGTLTVTDGTHNIDLTLLGSYVTNNFTLSTDNHGGTLVTDPPLVAGAPRLTFADIAPAKGLAGTADPGNSLGYPPVTLASNQQPHAGQTLLATGPPGAGDHHSWLPMPR